MRIKSMDERLRDALSSAPESIPSDMEWQSLRKKIKDEGLFSTRKRFLFFLSFSFTLAGIAAVMFFSFKDRLSSDKMKTGKINAQFIMPAIKFKVQIAALRNKDSAVTFHGAGEVTKEKDSDGYTRYYAGSYDTKKEASQKIEKLKNNNYTDAFIKESYNAIKENPINKNAIKEGSKLALTNKVESKTVASKSVTGASKSSLSLPPISKQAGLISKSLDSSASPKIKSAIEENSALKMDSVCKPVKDTTLAKEVPDTTETKKEINPTTVSSFPRWAIGPYFGINQGGYALVARNSNGNELLTANHPGLKGTSTLNYSTGIFVAYNLNKRITFQGGLLFSQKSKVLETYGNIGFRADTIITYTNYEFNYASSYVDLNLNGKVYLNNGKWRTYGLIGIITQFNFPGNNSYFKLDSYGMTSHTDKIVLNPFSMGLQGQVAFGCEMTLSNSWSIYLEPIYKYSFNPVLKHPTYQNIPVDHYSRAFGLGAGLFYHF